MSFTTLKPEIWMHILEFLRPPLPKPLSGLTKQEAFDEPIEVTERLPDEEDAGVTRRKDIRSDALAKLMRTSVAFNQLASLPLYRRVMTDNFSGLIHGLGAAPATADVKSKSELLAHIRRLHIEQGRKGGNPDLCFPEPTYEQAMGDIRRWSMYGLAQYQVAAIQAARELWTVHGAIRRTAADSVPVFPNLTHLTTGMIFGSQPRSLAMVAPMGTIADPYHSGKSQRARRSVKELVMACKAAMVETFRKSPIAHYCQRGSSASFLSLPYPICSWGNNGTSFPSSSFSSIPPKPIFNIHYNIHPGTNHMPMVIGHRTQWLMEPCPPAEHFDVILSTVGEAMHTLLTSVDDAREKHVTEGRGRANLDLGIYGSTTGRPSPIPVSAPLARNLGFHYPNNTDAKHEQAMISDFNGDLRKYRNIAHPLGKGIADSFDWQPSAASPACQACGWFYETA